MHKIKQNRRWSNYRSPFLFAINSGKRLGGLLFSGFIYKNPLDVCCD